MLLLCTEALRMNPITFEKDEGMHIDFIAAASVSHFAPNMATVVSTLAHTTFASLLCTGIEHMYIIGTCIHITIVALFYRM